MLSQEKIKGFFLQMTEQQDATPFRMYLDAASSQVQQLLRPEYVENPPDLVCAYAAAQAMRMWTAVRTARVQTTCTTAGTLAVCSDFSAERAAADALCQAYLGLCSRYLQDEAFTMRCIAPHDFQPERRKMQDAQSDSSGDAQTLTT
jgi:hypothetical protein